MVTERLIRQRLLRIGLHEPAVNSILESYNARIRQPDESEDRILFFVKEYVNSHSNPIWDDIEISDDQEYREALKQCGLGDEAAERHMDPAFKYFRLDEPPPYWVLDTIRTDWLIAKRVMPTEIEPELEVPDRPGDATQEASQSHIMPTEIEPEPATPDHSGDATHEASQSQVMPTEIEPEPATPDHSGDATHEASQSQVMPTEIEPEPETPDRSGDATHEASQSRIMPTKSEPETEIPDRSGDATHEAPQSSGNDDPKSGLPDETSLGDDKENEIPNTPAEGPDLKSQDNGGDGDIETSSKQGKVVLGKG